MRVDGNIMEVVNNFFVLLGPLITNDGPCIKEIRKQIGVGKCVTGR